MLVPKYRSSATLLLTQTEQKSDDEAITQSDVNLNNNHKEQKVLHQVSHHEKY